MGQNECEFEKLVVADFDLSEIGENKKIREEDP
jgi:hypothetical protein